jgi:hypothetical protein
MVEVVVHTWAVDAVADPFIVVMDVRGFGMTFAVGTRFLGRGSGSFRCATNRDGTVFGNVSATDAVGASSTMVVLGECRQAQEQDQQDKSGEYFHVQPPRKTLSPARGAVPAWRVA